MDYIMGGGCQVLASILGPNQKKKGQTSAQERKYRSEVVLLGRNETLGGPIVLPKPLEMTCVAISYLRYLQGNVGKEERENTRSNYYIKRHLDTWKGGTKEAADKIFSALKLISPQSVIFDDAIMVNISFNLIKCCLVEQA